MSSVLLLIRSNTTSVTRWTLSPLWVGVFLASGSTTEHLVIRSSGQDYQVSFLGADSGAAANVSFVGGALTRQTGNAGGTDISLTNSGGGAFNSVNIASAVNNSVAGGQGEFIDIRVFSEGSITRTNPDSQIITDNLALFSGTGSIGAVGTPILTTVSTLCAETTAGRGYHPTQRDSGYPCPLGMDNLLLYYNKPNGNLTAEVQVDCLLIAPE